MATERAYSAVEGGLVDMVYYDALRLDPGMVVEGPAILQAPTTTILVDSGDSLTVRADGGFLISVALKG